MKVAIVSDIHGNINGLKLFLKYVDDNKISLILNLGDFLGGENPVEVLRIIKEDYRFISVLGNHDEALEFIEDELTKNEKNYLLNLPMNKVISLEGKKLLMVHSRVSSNKDIPYVFNGKSLGEFLNDYEGDYDYVLFGHTHYQCLLSHYHGKTMINPGSLGLSYDEKISFTIIDINEESISINFIKL